MSKYTGIILVGIVLLGFIGMSVYRGISSKPVLLSDKYNTQAGFIRYLDGAVEVFEPETYEEDIFTLIGISGKEYTITQRGQKDRNRDDVIDICMGCLKVKKVINYEEDIDYAKNVFVEFPDRKLQNLYHKLTNEIVYIEESENDES